MPTVHDLTMNVVEVVEFYHHRIRMAPITVERFRYVGRYEPAFCRGNPEIPILVPKQVGVFTVPPHC
jgi:hypothetical protein